MTKASHFDVIVIGGGLAGLSLSIFLAKAGTRVALFEKETYPFHRVCGEYISLESYGLVQDLGINLESISVPIIKKLVVSAPSGKLLRHELPLGGFGISRFRIDDDLAQQARKRGVVLFEQNRVDEVERVGEEYGVRSGTGEYTARIVCAAYGKRSNLDVRWRRPFVLQKANAINNFVGVKYHVRLPREQDLIELHNFSDGYCGVSSVEDGIVCICYLTSARNLRENGNSIHDMERNVLFKNPHIKKVFSEAEHLYAKPLAISQVSFAKKKQYEDGIFFLGDAASMITPLCGNGMSMALHSGRMLSEVLIRFLKEDSGIEEAGREYMLQWQSSFGTRLFAGRVIQRIFGKEWISAGAVSLAQAFPGLLTKVIRLTHG